MLNRCYWKLCILLSFSFCHQFGFFFPFFRAAVVYGRSQTRGRMGYSCWPMSQPQQYRIQAASVTYTTAHGNTSSLTHWVRPGVKPSSSWILVGFVTAEPQWELQSIVNLNVVIISSLQQNDSVNRYTYPFPFRFFSHIYYHRILGRVLCAIQQVPVDQSFHVLQCAYARVKPLIHPSPTCLFTLETLSMFSKSANLFLFCK